MYSLLRFPAKVAGALAMASCILIGSIVLIVFAEWYRRRGIQAQQEGLI
jgi:spermidine/putrescine transport system permease protein